MHYHVSEASIKWRDGGVVPVRDINEAGATSVMGPRFVRPQGVCRPRSTRNRSCNRWREPLLLIFGGALFDLV